MEKYSGRGLPGLSSDVLDLVIPASSFVLHFHNGVSSNTWGYKLTVTAYMPKSAESSRIATMNKDTLNTGPFFIGRMPYWVDCAPVAPVWIANLNGILNFHLIPGVLILIFSN